MLQRLPIALTQVKVANTTYEMKCEKSYILCIKQKNTKNLKVCNNIMNPINESKMITIFMYSENGKTSDPQRLFLNLSYKLNLRSDKCCLIKS